MKIFILILICALFSIQTIDLSAQGITKNGQSTSTSTIFVNKNGKVSSNIALNKYGMEAVTFTIGMPYQGGILAYILQPGDAGYIAGVNQGFITTAVDLSTGAPWGCVGNTYELSYYSNGNDNTNMIVSQCPTAGIAAKLAYDLVSGGYSDWYLPSTQELSKLYLNRVAIGGFAAANYWSSSHDAWWDDSEGEQINNGAYYINFSNGLNYNSYGNENSSYRVRAIRNFGLASVTTNAITGVASTSATCGGNVITDGSQSVTARGVCWSTSPNPTIANSTTNDGTGTGAFTSSITGLTAGVTYYVRSYVTNASGTAYGNQVSFRIGDIQISTLPFTVASISSATGGGNIASDGGAPITARGVCWSTSPNPTIANSYTTDGSGIGQYTSTMTGLSVNTYYVRAYATNSAGTTYGNEIQVASGVGAPYLGGVVAYILKPGDVGYIDGMTQGLIAATSDVSTGAPWGCTGNQLSLNFEIGYGNSNTVTIVGQCTTAGIAAKLANDWVNGGYSDWYLPTHSELGILYQNRSLIGGFAAANYWSSSHYYYYDDFEAEEFNYGAYYLNFTNGVMGNGYNNENSLHRVRAIRSFGIASVTTNAITGLAPTSATCGGNATTDGGSPVTARGVCWSTSPNPTIANSRTTDGSGTGVFSSTMTGLTPGVTYYVRAYVTNASGTIYGNQNSFIIGTIAMTTTSVSNITSNSAQSGGNITSDGGAPITARGICWSVSPNPTLANNFTTDGSGMGSYTSTMTGLAMGAYYVRAYATNGAGTTYGNEVQFTVGIGTAYQGGVIAYILKPGDPGYVAGVPHGLITTTTDLSAGAIWGCQYNGINTDGSGNSNTNIIVADCTTAGIAAKLAYDLNSGGYTDWYLPSIGELLKIYPNRVAIGGFSAANYWSSTHTSFWDTEGDYFNYGASYLNFSNGVYSDGYGNENQSYRVRAVRTF